MGTMNLFAFIESTFDTDEQLNDIMHEEKRNPQLFDLAHGLVFRCHILYYKQISPNHLLSDKDALIFNFHHALFDFPSMDIFLHDLNQAYTTGQLSNDDNTTLRYLDCTHKYMISSFHIKSLFSSCLDSIIEQQMPMTGASMFWLDTLHDCKLDQSLPLPFDRYRLSMNIEQDVELLFRSILVNTYHKHSFHLHHQTTYHLNILHLPVIMSSCLN